LLFGLDDELRLEHGEHILKRPQGEVSAAGEHAAQLPRIDAGGPNLAGIDPKTRKRSPWLI
jgi:hypothetical protein